MALYYTLYQDTRTNSKYKDKWYAKCRTTEVVGLDGLAEHMAKHSLGYSKGQILGILMDFRDCALELILESKKVKVDNLAILYPSLQTLPADTAGEFSATSNIDGIRVKARGTGTMRSSFLSREFELKLSPFKETAADASPAAAGGGGQS